MKILVIGSGGREHALVWKLAQSPRVKKIFCAPGNGGIASQAVCVDIKADDVVGLKAFALQEKIDLTVVGPEGALVKGIVDAFEKAGLNCFGPSQGAAQLEGSKIFAKEFMRRYKIPTADFKRFDQFAEAVAYLHTVSFPIVIKADGLAAGKGVVICETRAQAEEALTDILVKKIFKEAGQSVVIEEFLKGEEVSILAISDGTHLKVCPAAQDHKRVGDGDSGLNTGGMGAYSPAPVVTDKDMVSIKQKILRPVIAGMRQEGHPFKGVLYAGLMMTARGPYVLEFNVRFGDPEAQAILPRLETDLVDVLEAACQGRLSQVALRWTAQSCICVVLCAKGYPGPYETGKVIRGLKEAGLLPGTVVFHAGTQKVQNDFLTGGGRVLGVVSWDRDIELTRTRVYQAVTKIDFEGCFFRRDIAVKALAARSPVAARFDKV